jgi:hypothetical protein
MVQILEKEQTHLNKHEEKNCTPRTNKITSENNTVLTVVR